MDTSALYGAAALYLAVGACLVLFTRARPQVFDTSLVRNGNSPIKAVLVLAVVVTSAVVLWPVFVRDWFRKPVTAWDAFMAIPGVKEQGQLYEAMLALCEDGVDADELPNGAGSFGFDVSNPIPTKTIFGSRVYLSRLETDGGEAVLSERIGSTTNPVCAHPIDAYSLRLESGRQVGTIYISPYHLRNSSKAPRGFRLKGSEAVAPVRGNGPGKHSDHREKPMFVENFRFAMYIEMARTATSRNAFLHTIEESYGPEATDEAGRIFDMWKTAAESGTNYSYSEYQRGRVGGPQTTEQVSRASSRYVEPRIVPLDMGVAGRQAIVEEQKDREPTTAISSGLKLGRDFVLMGVALYCESIEGKPAKFRSSAPLCQYTAGWLCGGLLAGVIRLAGLPKGDAESSHYDLSAFREVVAICNREASLAYMRGIELGDIERLVADSAEYRKGYEQAYTEYGRMVSGDPMFFPRAFGSYMATQ